MKNIRKAIAENYSLTEISNQLIECGVNKLPMTLQAAIWLQIEGRSSDALTLIEILPDDSFVQALHSKIVKPEKKEGRSRPIGKRAVEALKVWNRTKFSIDDRAYKIKQFVEYASTVSLLHNRELSVLDLGCGDGELCFEFIRRLFDFHDFKHVRITMLDREGSMLESARSRFMESNLASRGVGVSFVNEHLENLGTLVEAQFGEKNFDISIVSESLHHLSGAAKAKAFAAVSRLSQNCFLAELVGNHDRPESGTAELALSTWTFYRALIDSVQNNDLKKEEQEKCIGDFLLDEAFRILSQPRSARENFHCCEADWKKHAANGNFSPVNSVTTTIAKGSPDLFVAHLRSKLGPTL